MTTCCDKISLTDKAAHRILPRRKASSYQLFKVIMFVYFCLVDSSANFLSTPADEWFNANQ